jgi:hypothetical protein
MDYTRSLPSVLGSSISTYLPLTSFINLSNVNQYWRTISQSPSSRHPHWGTYDLSYIDGDKDGWLKQLVPYGIVSLKASMHLDERSVDLTRISSTLRLLEVGCINTASIRQLTNLTSFTLRHSHEAEVFTAIALLPLRHYRYEPSFGCSNGTKPPPLPSMIDYLPSSLTSLEYLDGSNFSASDMRQLLTRLPSLRHLDIGTNKDAFEPLFTSKLTSMVFRGSLPITIASLQRIDFPRHFSSIGSLRAISMAAPNITHIDNIDVQCHHGGYYNRGRIDTRDEFIMVIQSFKHLQYLSLHLMYNQLCDPLPSTSNSSIGNNQIDNDTKATSSVRTISLCWLPLAPVLKELHVYLRLITAAEPEQASTLSIKTFTPLNQLKRLHLRQIDHDDALYDAIVSGSFAFCGLPQLQSITLVNRIPVHVDWRMDYPAGDTDTWQPFIESFGDIDYWRRLNVYITDMALLLAWLAIPTSFVIPSQMIGEVWTGQKEVHETRLVREARVQGWLASGVVLSRKNLRPHGI